MAEIRNGAFKCDMDRYIKGANLTHPFPRKAGFADLDLISEFGGKFIAGEAKHVAKKDKYDELSKGQLYLARALIDCGKFVHLVLWCNFTTGEFYQMQYNLGPIIPVNLEDVVEVYRELAKHADANPGGCWVDFTPIRIRQLMQAYKLVA